LQGSTSLDGTNVWRAVESRRQFLGRIRQAYAVGHRFIRSQRQPFLPETKDSEYYQGDSQ
jgi:hypothetical protein